MAPVEHGAPKRQKPVSRRTISKGLAWSVPVVSMAAAAPAMAVSGCIVQTNFDDLTPGTTPTKLTFSPSLITATVGFTSTGNGNDNTPGATGKVAATATVPPWNYIEIEMLETLTAGDSITVTLTFSAAVENLSFKLHDIDSTTAGWNDQVRVGTAGYTFVLGSNLQGNGTNANRFRPVNVGDTPISSGLGDVTLKWAGPVSAVTFTYIAGINGSSQNQHIGLGNISFSDCVANPNTARQQSRVMGATPLSKSATLSESDGSVDL